MNRPEQWDSNTILRRFRARKLAFYDAAIRDGALTILEIRLMWRLIDRLNPQTGDCWPSLETVAAELRCNLRALKRAEKRLEEKGWFLTRRSGGQGRSNHYIPNWQKVIEDPLSDRQTQSGTVAGEAENSGSRVTETVAGQPPESINESVYESESISIDFAVVKNSNAPMETNSDLYGTIGTHETKHACQKNNPSDVDVWEDWINWLYHEGRYNEQWGYGSFDLAADDVERLRQACGDRRAIRCLEAARNRNLWGPVLQHHLRSAIDHYDR